MRDRPANWPRITIYCDGTSDKAHEPIVVAAYARNDSGSWLPTYTAVRRDGTEVFLRKTVDDADRGQFIWVCTWRGCGYKKQFRHPANRVAEVVEPMLDRFIAAGVPYVEATLRGIEEVLIGTPRADGSPQVSP